MERRHSGEEKKRKKCTRMSGLSSLENLTNCDEIYSPTIIDSYSLIN